MNAGSGFYRTRFTSTKYQGGFVDGVLGIIDKRNKKA